MADVTGECLGEMVPPPYIMGICCANLLAGEVDFGGATRVFLSPGGEGGEFIRGRDTEGRGNTGEEFNPGEYRIWGACPEGLVPAAEREAVAAAATAAAAADVAARAAAAAASEA